ncbi:hypothetical protein [Streptomyces sp. TLI_171]|uniref:hypothetical protein n=1 Tax=Streptomyces sp. TLI_171 TaxID=1938859 RepID=UPI0015FF2B04|nr:hypothetical protein [Streptomyces sp. TLI_171]
MAGHGPVAAPAPDRRSIVVADQARGAHVTADRDGYGPQLVSEETGVRHSRLVK